MKNNFIHITKFSHHFCEMCGALAEDIWETEPDRQVKLLLDVSSPGKFERKLELADLRVLCDECGEGLQNISHSTVQQGWLISAVERATLDDQKALMEWLQQKFAAPSK